MEGFIMADAITGNAELGATKNDLIISLVQKELSFAAKLSPLCRDLSAFAGKGVKSVKVPKLSQFSVVNRVSGAAGDSSALTSSVDTIDLDYNAYVAWIIDSYDEMQTSINAQVEFATRAARAHGRYVDERIIAEADAVAGLNLNGGAPADITRDNILDMQTFLMENDADMDRAALVINPSQRSAMLKIEEFTRADAYGASNIPAGFIGRVFGTPVVESNAFTGQQAYMWEMDGLGLAFQQRPNLSRQGANEYGSGAERYALDQVFGVGGLQLGEKGVLATESPLVAKLAD